MTHAVARPVACSGCSPGLSRHLDTEYVERGLAVRSPDRVERHGRVSNTGFAISDVLLTDVAEPMDIQLIADMAQGDERAASMLYDRHGAVLYGLALRMVGEPADAEEVVLDAFAQAWRDAGRYDTSRGSVAGWLTTITRTRALDLMRARGRRAKMTDTATATLDEPVAMGSGFTAPDVQVQDTERAVAVKSALDQLPVPQRQAIELAFFEGLTHHEVADRLREPLGTVKTRIRLGMQKLRDTLAGLAPEIVS
jgi:RNA polymerase sigma-70 factor (ECF subfamily)